MNQLDCYYRALEAYRAIVSQSRECSDFRSLVADAGAETDKMTITRTVCTIDEDWIEEIEKGLTFIEKALKEERQFIYSNGEVVPIEKVKHVSTESVRHLAVHSNLIGKVEEDGSFVPDRLYTVERLNEYAVYENRFLYMLLSYLRDFVSLRYTKILDISNKYDGVLVINKEAVLQKQKITYSISLHDERADDPYLRANNSAKETIDRIDLILKSIISYLSTPIMEIAAKTPMLKPPITKTNILKMDNNFKGAVALYDYIIAYPGEGYTLEEQKTDFAPFRKELAEELTDAAAILSFLMYKHGLALEVPLKNKYEKEEQARKDEAVKRREEKLASIKKRYYAAGENADEYILQLEKQIKALENRFSEIERMRREVYKLQDKNEELLQRTADAEQRASKQELMREDADAAHAKEIEDVKEIYSARIRENSLKHEKEALALQNEAEEKITLVKEEARKAQEEARIATENMSEKVREAEEASARLAEENAKLTEKLLVCEARMKAMRAQNGLMSEEDDFTEKESFGALEKEYKAFKKFYDGQWEKTKKKIRKKYLNLENLKDKKGE